MKTIKAKIRGIAPLLMENNVALDPFHPFAVQIREITSKGTKNRTEHDQKRLRWLEWQAHLYWSDEIGGPYVPVIAVESCLRNGARMFKKGKDVERGLMVNPEGNGELKLIFKPEHSTKEDLFKDTAFVDVRAVKSGGASKSAVLRTRPRFNTWSLEFSIAFDDELLKIEDVTRALENAGHYCGLLGYRPRHGRFESF